MKRGRTSPAPGVPDRDTSRRRVGLALCDRNTPPGVRDPGTVRSETVGATFGGIRRDVVTTVTVVVGSGARTAGRSAFPSRASRFIGRADEAARLRAALGSQRVVTLIGTGGCGKTRLAVEVARELEPGYRD